MAIDGQQFCDSYADNDYKVLVHSPDNRVLNLVVNKHFWILDLKNGSLGFRSDDLFHGHYGSVDEFGPHITTLFSIEDYIGFYDVRHDLHSNQR